MSTDTDQVASDLANLRASLEDAIRQVDRAEDDLSELEDHDCEREHLDDWDGLNAYTRVDSQIEDWTRRLRMGYDLDMTKLEMLDELERMLR